MANCNPAPRIRVAPFHPKPDNVRWRILSMIGALKTKFQPHPVEFQTVAILSRNSYSLGGETMCGLRNSRSGASVHGLQVNKGVRRAAGEASMFGQSPWTTNRVICLFLSP